MQGGGAESDARSLVHKMTVVDSDTLFDDSVNRLLTANVRTARTRGITIGRRSKCPC